MKHGWQHHWKLIGILLVSLLLVVAGCAKQTKSTSLLSIKQIKTNIGSKLVTTRADKQKTLNQSYQDKVNSTQYSPSTPYVKVNPYQTSPLTALVIFQTSKPAKVSYTVEGKTDNTSITNSVNGDYTTTHQVPVVGLYSGDNTVQINVSYQDGTSETQELNIATTTSLPKYLKETDLKVTKNNKSKMDIGNNKLTLVVRTTKQSFAVDADGNIRWYSTLYTQHMIKQIHAGRLIMLSKNKQSENVYNDLLETDYLGRVYKEYNFSAKTGVNNDKLVSSSSKTKTASNSDTTIIHHDIMELPNHDLLATVNDGSKYVEDTMAVISHKTGKVTKVIDLKRLLPASMYQDYKSSGGKVDWFHQNSVEYDENDNSILISGRNQDMIMKISMKNDKIKWIYSGKKAASWPNKYRKLLLNPTKGTTITGGQHHLTLLEDVNNDPDSENVTLYDNNIDVTNGNSKTSGKYSQGVQYHINAKKMTIDQTWAYGKSLGKANYTEIIGSTQKLFNNNYLLDFGFKNEGKESNIIEVQNNKQVFNLTVPNPSAKAYVYRAYRWNFYPSDYVFDVTK
ncbi:aryl-sulfate sulfotransferase [Paucilactobacillus kaifaensis]|uniref:aryl-sulfate sulfotransferase n=1 Tax=Paucilactobacillus kaifaensis TaxID=2559921 RepID=UPI0010F537CA|nr:aryl-sulfate sulfotransferase [Paucilactobacillus kaifaensis]